MTRKVEYLKNTNKYLEIRFKKHQENWDSVIAIVGDTGTGKSNLGLHFLHKWCELKNGKVEASDVSSMCLTKEDFLINLATVEKKAMIVYDEAGDLSSRRAMSDFNVRLMLAYKVIRLHGLFTVLIIDDIFDLDTSFRNKKIKGLFKVTKRGEVKFWGRDKVRLLMALNQNRLIKSYELVSPDFTDKYPVYSGVMAKEYEKMKERKVEEYRKALAGEVKNPLDPTFIKISLLDELGYNIQEIAYELGMSFEAVRKYIYVKHKED